MNTLQQKRPADAGKRLVLVVDDEEINREMLGFMLKDEYEVLYAQNGAEALSQIREHAARLSLVLLDLLMPVMDGFEVLRLVREDEELSRIPVIVLTTEKSFEVKSLRLGASDFISKPYDLPEMVLARIQRTIELSEDKYIIQTTEYDALTGLYNESYFYQYSAQYERLLPQKPMDAVTVDVSHFRLFGELYGQEAGQTVLRRLADGIRAVLAERGGLGCRRDDDIFFLFLPHADDYEALRARLQEAVGEAGRDGRIQLCMGVYPCLDGTEEIPERFERARTARDTLHQKKMQTVAVYDASLHEQQLYQQRLIDEMDQALAERQFTVFYQPKYAIQGERPHLAGAEALIRWKHPTLGMISPGVFIPLFEENGLIPRLDRYVWREAAAQLAAWRDRYGVTIPVSVNVSRIDMYAPDLVATLCALVEENRLPPGAYHLEVTESAYTENSEQILRIVAQLRALGFPIEMDDFGSGYSSLNMLAELPIDALKLDMRFIRRLRGADDKASYIVQLMVNIAQYLSVPIIAEGVEEEAQLVRLKEMGCDVIQGYLFSPPVPPEEFEKLIEEELAK